MSMISFLRKNKKVKVVNSGFTLIELMVSLSIFATTMVVSVGTLIVMIDMNAKAQALYATTTNLSFMLDSMTREIRMGYHYKCSVSAADNFPDVYESDGGIIQDVSDCVDGNFIAFLREKDDHQLAYRLIVDPDTQKGVVEMAERDSTDDVVATWIPITSNDIDIDTFALTVENSTPYNEGSGDKKQPVVYVSIKGKLYNGLEDATEFNIQTRMVERRLDLI